MSSTNDRREILARRLSLRKRLIVAMAALVALSIPAFFLLQFLETQRKEQAAFEIAQTDYLATWCSTFGAIKFDTDVPHQQWKASFRRDFDLDEALTEWRDFASKNGKYLRGRPELYQTNVSGRSELIFLAFFADGFYPWSNHRVTQDMIREDLEFAFWSLHEIFGNDENEYGKPRPSC